VRPGKALEAFLRERLFDPLHMPDTGFTVSLAQRPRFTTAYRPDHETGEIAVADSVENSCWNRPLPFPSAAGWLVSTIDDYWAFVQMILSRGVHRGERLLAEQSVDYMTTDHLTREQRAASHLFLGDHGGWGVGMLAPAAGLDGAHARRVFGWDGGLGTTWRSDVDTGLTGILLTQLEMTSPQPPAAFTDFWDSAYRAFE
jgi:CubicO group peptidase (beta-lactamase class C family)